jgi:small subunit ribosomal protein S1
VKITKVENVETPRGSVVRIGLSIKQAGGEPWENLPGHIQAGSVVEGKVTRLAKFGAFVQLAPGVEGLVPLSEMSYTKRVMNAEEIVKEGEVVTVMIQSLSPETHRIGLSIKDAGQDPWALIGQNYPVNRIVKGKITRREAYGLFVQLEEGIVGLLPKSKAMENPEFPFEKLRVNDEVTVQVAELRASERRISLQVPKDPDADEWRKYSPKVEAVSGGGFGGVFGDAFKKALDKKKK